MLGRLVVGKHDKRTWDEVLMSYEISTTIKEFVRRMGCQYRAAQAI